MVNVKNVVALSIAVAAVNAAPVTKTKRIAQVISDSTTKWVAACTAAGGGSKCGDISIKAFSTLLAAPGACEQQDAADDMIDLAKTLANNAQMISLAQVFRQQPRNAPDSLSVLYCQKAPRNAELNGLFQCQFQGCNPAVFTGNVKVGAPGTIPFGLKAALNPAGSCAASPKGPVTDGAQLTDTTTNPGVAGAAGGAKAPPPPAAKPASPATPPPAAPPATPAAPASDAKPFTLQNGKDAIALNQKFAGLNANSACTNGDQACVGSSFAQCVGGKFALTQCAGGTICAALPLVNKAGTTITCTTPADRDARIAVTGATAGAGANNSAGKPAAAPPAKAVPAKAAAPATSPAKPAAKPAAGAKSFTLQNGKDAKALNAKFAKLTASSACQAGDQACVGGKFAQCVGGKFVSTACAGGTVCAALPLVNKAGTSIACTTPADRDARIAATGA